MVSEEEKKQKKEEEKQRKEEEKKKKEEEKRKKKEDKEKSKDDGYDPWEHREIEKPYSDWAAFFHLTKAAVGTGVLCLPICYYRGGIIPGGLYAILVTALVLYCTFILIRTQYYVAKRNEIPYAPYGYTMNDCFMNGPGFFHKIARLGEVFVDIFICLFHLGTLTVYIAFIAQTVVDVFELQDDIPIRLMQVYVALCLIIFVNISNMKAMTIVSITGAIILVICFAFLFYYIFRPDEDGFKGADDPRYFGSIPEGPLMIGAMLFGTNTLGVILSIDENMKNPSHLLGVFGVFPVATMIIVTLYTFVGIVGYLKYGEDIRSSLSLNIPVEDMLAKCIMAGFALSVTCSFPIHVTPAVSVVWRKYTRPKVKPERNPYNIIEYAIRTALLFLCLALAVSIPMIDVLTSLVGSLTLSFLGVFFPALVHYLYLWSQTEGKRTPIMYFDIFIMIVGVIMVGITTYASIISIEDGETG